MRRLIKGGAETGGVARRQLSWRLSPRPICCQATDLDSPNEAWRPPNWNIARHLKRELRADEIAFSHHFHFPHLGLVQTRESISSPVDHVEMPPVRFNRKSVASSGNPTRSTPFTANVAPLADPPLAIFMNESSEQTPTANNGNTFTSPSLLVPVATPAKIKLTLLGYQREAIDRFINALHGGFTRVSVSAATGSGKTVTFLSMIKQIPKRGEGDKVLILVPTISIIRQIKGELRKWFRNVYEVDEEQGDKEPEDMSADM